MIEGTVIEPFQGSESERIATQGGALRAYPGLCHRTPLGFRRGVIAETLKPDSLQLSDEDAKALLTKEEIVHEHDMIVKIVQPDMAGGPTWIFRHGDHSFEAQIIDRPWLQKFLWRQHKIMPGDSIRARVRINTAYDDDGEVIEMRYWIMAVAETISGSGPSRSGAPESWSPSAAGDQNRYFSSKKKKSLS